MKKTILQQVRTWIKTANGITDDKVLLENYKGPRPKTDYITVGFSEYTMISLGSKPTPDKYVVVCEGMIELNAFGFDAFDWLRQTHLFAMTATGHALLKTFDFEPVHDFSGVFQASTVDTDREVRNIWNFKIFFEDSIETSETIDVTLPAVDVLYDTTFGEDEESEVIVTI